MKIYAFDDKVLLSVENLPNFYELLQQANEKSEELRQILNKLSNFDVRIGLDVKSGSDSCLFATDAPAHETDSSNRRE